MVGLMESDSLINPSGLLTQKEEVENPNISNSKPKVVVIMGATGSGKSRLAIDLASNFPIEIINADSMQVYQGLDVLTNKVPVHDQRGVPHHLLGTISPMVEFTAKNFRDCAISLINDITSRNHLPVIVGGTNYYIQAFVSRFLLDESSGDADESCLDETNGDKEPCIQLVPEQGNFSYGYDSLKDIDPVAANRIHPNDHRKISQYLHLYACSGVLPSKYLQEKTMENWGDADNLRYNCCFICVDASLPVIDKYVEQRVDQMVDAGLLGEVYDIFNPDADYTRGLRQAIGVREFEVFLKTYLSEGFADAEKLKENMNTILSTSDENPLKQLLQGAIGKVKLNTRRLVRRQKRRLLRLQTLFGWNIHYVDATESLSCSSEELWTANVVKPSIEIIKSYYEKDISLVPDFDETNGIKGLKLMERDLWTQHICKACGNKVLRGAYEWEQHKQGRSHRKRVCRLRKSGVSGLSLSEYSGQ